MERGGAQTQVANLFLALDRDRFDLSLICLREKGALGAMLEERGFPVVEMGKRGRVHPAMLLRLARLLREWKIDIVHCSVFTANLWGRLAGILAGTPVLIAHEQSTVSLEKRSRRQIDRLLAPFTWRVLTVSEDLRRRVLREERLSPRRVEILFNAVDEEAISRAAASATACPPGLEKWRGENAFPRPPIVGAVGRLEYRKDHLTLVRAAARVLERRPEAVFLLAGEGPDRPKIEAELRALGLEGRFVLLGERADIPALLRAFDVYVLSSITEGLSLSILEAMAAGCPVAATRVGGNPELLDEGRAGLLCEAGDVEGLASILLELLDDADKRGTLARAAKRRVRETFDIHPVARRLEDLYRRAMSERRGS
jgi:glycosyltransferase involved in cell wall biosynthesis